MAFGWQQKALAAALCTAARRYSARSRQPPPLPVGAGPGRQLPHRHPPCPPCSNLFEWAVTVLGPPDTLYEGGFFNAVLKFPKDYPQSPPDMRFTSEMW